MPPRKIKNQHQKDMETKKRDRLAKRAKVEKANSKRLRRK